MSTTDDPGQAGTSDVRDLLGAYALDAVDDVERRAVERLVERDADAARELAELTATAALLGSAVRAPAPADVRASVLDAIRSTPQLGARGVRDDAPTAARPGTAGATLPGPTLPGPAVPGPAVPGPAVPGSTAPASTSSDPVDGAGPADRGVTDLADRRRPRRSTAWLAVAATAVGAAAVPSVIAWQQNQEARRASEQARVLAELLAEPGTEVVRAEVEGGGTAVGVLGADEALFTATGLDDPGAGKEYQLWVIRDGVPLPDVVMPDESGALRGLAEDFTPGDALAVTVEPAGGSQEPTTDPVVVLAPAEA
ncbi:anti-sigma factor domain-containing protein [Cellulomonas cellasea]|uniref:Regulator of SigK n=1 Tax=Cellulomonas cellasea TaxID=43670 RepID=A0A7W4UI09_9CELL|nr:anti-sigma factor [Cellulomonas cellasea]MBB2924537.1 anti-sigma-K factor RskA [Cellulomonas cellasea]